VRQSCKEGTSGWGGRKRVERKGDDDGRCSWGTEAVKGGWGGGWCGAGAGKGGIRGRGKGGGVEVRGVGGEGEGRGE